MSRRERRVDEDRIDRKSMGLKSHILIGMTIGRVIRVVDVELEKMIV